MITEKERNVETNKLMHHTLAAVNNFKHRLDSLVSIDNIRSSEKKTSPLQKQFNLQANGTNPSYFFLLCRSFGICFLYL